MKTSGLSHSPAKESMIILIFALMVAVPALSQVQYISRENTFFSGSKRFAASIPDFYAAIEPVRRQMHLPSGPAPSSTPIKEIEGNTQSKINDEGTPAIITSFPLNENKKEISREKPLIRFTPTAFKYPKNPKGDVGVAYYPPAKLILYAKVLKEYARKNGFDTNYVFLCNMGMLSNTKRFFVINLVTMRIEQAGLVAHGRGKGTSIYDKQYSNLPGSKSTSLGRYKISAKYKGSYGQSYRMMGLDSSNKNAYNRSIVLHSMTCIPDTEANMPACVSEGCPAVSTKFLASLRKIIDSRRKPVLMWIFDSNLEEAWVEERSEKRRTTDVPVVSESHTCSDHSAENPDFQ